MPSGRGGGRLRRRRATRTAIPPQSTLDRLAAAGRPRPPDRSRRHGRRRLRARTDDGPDRGRPSRPTATATRIPARPTSREVATATRTVAAPFLCAIPPRHGRPRHRRRAVAARCARPPAAVGRSGPSGTIEPMTVPRRVDAASLLLSLDPPPWFVRHARAVAEVAGWLAARIDAAGIAGRSPARRGGGAAPRRRQGAPGRRPGARPPPRRGLGGLADPRTGTLSWRGRSPAIRSRGWPTARRTDAGRRSRRARSGSSPTPTSAPASTESMDARFARGAAATRDGRRRSPRRLGRGDVSAVRARAARLEADVCRAAGVAPADVRRLRWTGAALACAPAARRRRPRRTRLAR